jgi:mRNA interferase MazF
MKKPTATSKPSLKFGDVVVVPFPYADKLAEKRRPAVLVSSTAFNGRQNLVWVVMITSAENKGWTDDIEFSLKGTGLSSASVIRPSKIATIEKARIDRIIGKIDQKSAAMLAHTISAILGRP